MVKHIEHLIVVVTTNQMILIGAVLKASENQGPQTVELYNTNMSISVRGLGVEMIEASATTGRRSVSRWRCGTDATLS